MLSRGIYINTKSTIMKKNKTKTTKGEMGEREEAKKKGGSCAEGAATRFVQRRTEY